MPTLTIPLAPDRNASNMLHEANTSNYCSWDRFKDYLGLAAGIKHGERITGVVADESGLRIYIEYVRK